jgi:hypothetical protein
MPYVLDGWISFAVGARGFSLFYSLETGSGAQLTSYGSRGIFPRVSSGQSVEMTTHLHFIPR